MSLVAYAASSDEDSDNEEDMEQPQTSIPTLVSKNPKLTDTQNPINGQTSDDDKDYMPSTSAAHSGSNHRVLSLSLPKPKNFIATTSELSQELNDVVAPIFAKLPMPKDKRESNDVIEEDDEFLHKKAMPLPDTEAKKPKSAPTGSTKATVKITIPSMKDFADVDEDLAKSGSQLGAQTQIKLAKKSGLLAVLPPAKSEQNFAKCESKNLVENAPRTSTSSVPKTTNMLIPDTVRTRRAAKNTEGVDGALKSTSTLKTPKTRDVASAKASLVDCSDSEASDDGTGDFFSLNNDDKLPQVNANELNVMVAKRAAKMAVATTKYLESSAAMAVSTGDCQQPDDDELRRAQKRYHDSQLNEEALQALVGSKSKRRRQQHSEIEIVDISGQQVLPDRDEWMRTALASSTTYQPTGQLVDEEPASGTRRKHQITYLAHKAKANEAELQAMWAANRQNRRATQSKYGF